MPAYNASALVLSLLVGESALLFNNEAIAAPELSIPVFLGVSWSGVAPAYTVEVSFSGAPGAFSLQMQEADTNHQANFINPSSSAYTISSVNSGNVGRSDLIPAGGRLWAAYFSSLANSVNATVKLTRVQ